jgi:energy-coupling factor transport system ATP-binding protein
MIQLKDLSFSYLKSDGSKVSETPQLNNVNLRINAGEFVLVCGPTGSGKSTFLKALNGLAPSFTGGVIEGELIIDGVNLIGLEPHEFASKVGFVNQQPENAFVGDTVIDEIVYCAEQLGLSIPQISESVEKISDVLEISYLLERPLATLSGGQQQRVAIASALVAGQKILLLDEPTSALDLEGASEVLRVLQKLSSEEGVTVLLAEHRISRVIAAVDSVLVVHGDGSVTKGPTATQFNDSRFAPPIIELGVRLGWKPLPISTSTAHQMWLQTKPKFRAMTPFAPSADVLQVQHLEVSFGSLLALQDTSFSLQGNQITALMGENGSGKTTLCWAIQGSGARTKGKVITAKGDTADLSANERLEVITMVPQRAADLLFLSTLSAELEESDRFADVESGSTAKLFKSLAGRIDTSIHPRDLSAGQQLSLVLAIQLVKQANILILDEPTRGLDYSAKHALAKQLNSIRSADRSVLIATHDIEFVAMVSDRVLVLEDGKLITDSIPTQVLGAGAKFASQLAEISNEPGLISLEQVEL